MVTFDAKYSLKKKIFFIFTSIKEVCLELLSVVDLEASLHT